MMRSEPLRHAASDTDEIVALRARVADLELKNEELLNRVKMRELETENQIERSDCLEIMLQKLGEKDDTTELLLEQMREENLALSERMATTQDELQDKIHLLQNMEERCEELEDQVAELRRGHGGGQWAAADVDHLTAEIDGLRLELHQAHEKLHISDRELISRTSLFEQRLATVERERDDVRNSLTVERSKAAYHALEVDNKQAELVLCEQQLRQLKDLVQAIQPSFKHGLENVEYQIEGRLQDLHGRLIVASDNLYDLTQSANFIHVAPSASEEDDSASLPISRAMLEKMLRDTQHSQQEALARHEEDDHHIQQLSDTCHRLEQERSDLLYNMQEMERLMRNNAKPAVTSISAVEVSDLKARLCAVENRAEKAAAEHAKLYAQHVKTIAYLESECSRLHGMADHFRAHNTKLSDDLKKARLENTKCRGLEHRITILAENEKTLHHKVQMAERALLERNEEILSLIRDKESDEMHKQRKIEREITESNEQIEQLHRQLQEASKSYDSLMEKLHTIEHEAKIERHQLQSQVDHLQHENVLQLRQSDDLEFQLTSVREDLRHQHRLLRESDLKLGNVIQDAMVSTANYDRLIRDLNAELEEKTMRVQVLDQSVLSMRTQIVSLESHSLHRDEELTVKLIQRGDLDFEVQSLRDRLQQKITECVELQQNDTMQKSQTAALSSQLRALETRYQELIDVNLKQANERAVRSEGAYRQAADELTAAKAQLRNQDELLHAARSSLAEVEHSLQELQNAHIVLQTNEQVARATNETLVEEVELLRSQQEELIVQLTAATQKYWTNESAHNATVDQLKDCEHQVKMLEKKLSELKAHIAVLEASEARSEEDLEDIVAMLTPLMDLFEHTNGTPLRGHHDSQTTDIQVHYSSSFSTSRRITEWITTLKTRSSMTVKTVTSLQHRLRDRTLELENVVTQFDLLKVAHGKTDFEKQDALNRLKQAEKQIVELQESSSKLRSHISTWEETFNRKQKSMREMIISFGTVLQNTATKVMGELDSLRMVDAHIVLSEFKETMNILVVRDDLSAEAKVGANSADSFEHHIAAFHARAECLILMVSQSIEAYGNEKKELYQTVDKLKESIDRIQQEHEFEINEHLDKQRELQDESNRLYHQVQDIAEEIQQSTAENISLKQTNKDLTTRAGQLENELKDTAALNQELADSIRDAGAIHEELQEEIKGLHGELDRKEHSIKTLQEQLATARKRIGDSDLQFEKLSANIQRLRAEKDALENVRQSLESELDRSRAEYLSIMDKYNPSNGEDSGYVFELEKLLAALSSTADQIEENFGPSSETSQTDIVLNLSNTSDVSKGSSAEDRLLEVQKRVEYAVNRQARIRTRSREEGRNRKLLERQQQSLNDEVKKLVKMSESTHNQLQACEKRCLDLASVIEDKEHEIQALHNKIRDMKAEEGELARRCSEYEINLDHLKKDNMRLAEEVQNRSSEAIRISRSMESCELTVSKLQAELNTVKLDHEHTLLDVEQRTQQLKVSTENHQKALMALSQAEASLSRERASRNELDSKLLLLEGEGSQATRSRIVQLTGELDHAKEENRALHHIKFMHEDRISTLEQDLQSARQQVSVLESRIDSILREKLTVAEEIAETKNRIQAAKDSLESEKAMRLRSEAAIDALKRAQGEDKRKSNLEGLITIRNNDTETLHHIAEEEKRILRSKIQELKMAHDETEMLRLHEVDDKKRMEKEIEQLHALLTRRTEEINSASTFSSTYRKEVRSARKRVLEIIAQTSEIINSISLDLNLGFSDSSSALRETLDLKVDMSSVKLTEDLGLAGLTDLMSKLRDMVARYITEHARLKMTLQSCSDSENERDRLRGQVNSLLEQRSALLAQQAEEKKTLQNQLLRLKNDDGDVQKLLAQIANLEGLLKKEKERKDRAIAELKEVRTEVDRLTGNTMAVKERTHELDDEAAALHNEVQRLHGDNNLLRLEVDKLNAHRSALKDAVDQMDRRLRLASDPTSPVDQAERPRRDGDHNNPSQAWLVARYQARARAMEELAGIYRQSLHALSPEGPPSRLLAYQQMEDNASGLYPKMAVNWIEKEINTVRDSYNEEIRCLDAQVVDLYSKLKEHQAYEAEMRKQLDDISKSFYRMAKESAPPELNQLRRELERAVGEVSGLQEDLVKERKGARARHVKLVEDLTRSLEAREVALLALKKLEKHCKERGFEIANYALFEVRYLFSANCGGLTSMR